MKRCVAKFRLPIPLGAFESLNTFIEEAYGKDATFTGTPPGWVSVYKPEEEIPDRCKDCEFVAPAYRAMCAKSREIINKYIEEQSDE